MTIEVKEFNALVPAFDLAKELGELPQLVEDMRLITFTYQEAFDQACENQGLHPQYHMDLVDIDTDFYEVDGNTYLARDQKFMVDIKGLISDLEAIKAQALAEQYAIAFASKKHIKARRLI